MSTELAINGALLERAFHLGGLETENETVNVALHEFIAKRAKEDVISLFNTVEYDEDYDWKQLRGRK
ncbi:MAG: type II toxin-antitoxin system VapB family antitoxin [Treponema sp.]|nr:type II toxin-antitoxin system VapB family antitoxin [Treponema sp.]